MLINVGDIRRMISDLPGNATVEILNVYNDEVYCAEDISVSRAAPAVLTLEIDVAR